MPGFGHIGNVTCQPSAGGSVACLEAGWTPEAWTAYCAAEDASLLEASLGFVLAQSGIDRIVVGVDTAAQLEEILAVGDLQMAPPPDTLASDDLDLINPSRWDLS